MINCTGETRLTSLSRILSYINLSKSFESSEIGQYFLMYALGPDLCIGTIRRVRHSLGREHKLTHKFSK